MSHSGIEIKDNRNKIQEIKTWWGKGDEERKRNARERGEMI